MVQGQVIQEVQALLEASLTSSTLARLVVAEDLQGFAVEETFLEALTPETAAEMVVPVGLLDSVGLLEAAAVVVAILAQAAQAEMAAEMVRQDLVVVAAAVVAAERISGLTAVEVSDCLDKAHLVRPAAQKDKVVPEAPTL